VQDTITTHQTYGQIDHRFTAANSIIATAMNCLLSWVMALLV